jgi:hypothetical protein
VGKPRPMPGPEQFTAWLREFADQHVFADADTHASTHAIPWGDRHHHGFTSHVQTKAGTTGKRATDWVREMALSDDPPFYWLDIRHGYVNVIRKHPKPKEPGELAMYLPGELVGPAVRHHVDLHLDARGGFYDTEDPKASPYLMAKTGDWLATPQALRHLMDRAETARMRADRLRREAWERDAAEAEAMHGPALSVLRGLLAAAELPMREGLFNLCVERSDEGAQAVLVSLDLTGAELDQLGKALAEHGVPPVERTPIT